MVVCGAKSEMSLLKERDVLEQQGIRHHCFYEPDPLDDSDEPMGFTALASEPVYGEQRRLFRRWRVL